MRFTAIVCTYNYAHLLPDALRTLAAQKLRDFETLIVDDGSTDRTEEVVRRFARELDHLVYLKKPHTGLADSRNFAVRAATGDFLGFLDADDFWSPDYVGAIERTIEAQPQAELLFSNGFHVRGNGKVLRRVFAAGLPPVRGPIRSSRELFLLCVDFCPTGTVFSKALAARVGDFDPRFNQGLGDDVDWVIRAMTDGAYTIRIDQPLFIYRSHGSNLTTNPIAFLEPWLKIYTERLRHCPIDSEFPLYARRFTRDYVLRLLGICPASRGRELLAETLRAFPGDAILKAAFASTYFGSTVLLKTLKFMKRQLSDVLIPRPWIDLSARPDALFESVGKLWRRSERLNPHPARSARHPLPGQGEG